MDGVHNAPGRIRMTRGRNPCSVRKAKPIIRGTDNPVPVDPRSENESATKHIAHPSRLAAPHLSATPAVAGISGSHIRQPQPRNGCTIAVGFSAALSKFPTIRKATFSWSVTIAGIPHVWFNPSRAGPIPSVVVHHFPCRYFDPPLSSAQALFPPEQTGRH
jgi:hypothetical protein